MIAFSIQLSEGAAAFFLFLIVALGTVSYLVYKANQ